MIQALWRMHDAPDASKPALPVSLADARDWNTPERGFGIFQTINMFDGPRLKQNLIRIVAWAIDIDEGTKQEQATRIESTPLVPSMIIETKRGFQVWWYAKDAKPEHWNAIVLERLVPFFGADKNARDLCRLLRAPGFWHLKNPQEPFLCEVSDSWDVAYSTRQMVEAFPLEPSRELASERHGESRRAYVAAGGKSSDGFWDAVYNLDCEEGLLRLSGSHHVNGERFTFRRTSRGRLNVFVDGKGTSVFIDENKRIGSLSGGGPTLIQWLKWYGVPIRDCVRVVKDLFPHLVAL